MIMRPVGGRVGQGCTLLAVALCSLWSASAVARERWETLTSGRITVLFRDPDRVAASRFLDLAQSSIALVDAEMGRDGGEPLTIVVASSDDEWRQVTGGSIPDWGVGSAHPERSLVVLKSPRIVSYPLQMETVVVHEIAHVAAGRVLSGTEVPRWFDEGVAMAVAGEWGISEAATLAGAVVTRTEFPLGELADGFPEGARAAALAYAESFQAVRFLTQQSGFATPGELVGAVAKEGDFQRAVEALTRRSVGRFEQDFRTYLRRRFGWGTALTGTGAAFLAATCVFLFAAAVKAGRTRRRLQELVDEDTSLRSRPRSRAGTSWQ